MVFYIEFQIARKYNVLRIYAFVMPPVDVFYMYLDHCIQIQCMLGCKPMVLVRRTFSHLLDWSVTLKTLGTAGLDAHYPLGL